MSAGPDPSGTAELVLAHVRAELADGPDAWLVGGAVRDRLRGRPTEDLDLAVATADPAVVRRLARGIARRAGGHAFALSDAFGAWRVTVPAGADARWQVDLTPLQGRDLAEDLGRRDLTVNAIAEPVHGGEPLDPTGGARDLRAGRLRAVGPGSFASDPVRVLRLARFAAELAAEPDPETLAAARAAAPALPGVPGERLLPELGRALTGPGWRRGVRVAQDTGALAAVLTAATGTAGRLRADVSGALEVLLGDAPEPPEADAADREFLARRAASAPDRLVLVLAALLRPAPDPAAALAPLRPSRELGRGVVRTVSGAGRIAGLRGAAQDPTALHAALAPAGDSAPHAVLLARAVLGADGLPWAALAARAVRWSAAPPRPPVTGDELAAALGLRPGPELGRLLRALAVAADAGEIGEAGEAVALARRLLGEGPSGPSCGDG